MGDIPQTAEDAAFGAADLEEGCRSGVYEEVTRGHAGEAMSHGALISSSFVVWQDSAEGRKGRFVVNLSKQSKHWPKGSVRMESISEFAMDIQRGDHFISMDIKGGYRHFRLAPTMRDWFLFRYEGRYYCCTALPFGCGKSPLWFTQMMAPFVRELRHMGFRVLAYLDDFLIAPNRHGAVATNRDCRRAACRIDELMTSLGLTRHPSKGEWEGRQVIEHLGVIIDSVRMKFFVAPRKVAKVQSLAGKLLKEVRNRRRWVTKKALTHFCGVCVSLTLAMPWARFYTRSMYWDMASNRPRDPRGRIRVSHQSIRVV